MSSKLSRNFPTVREASGAYILSARQELRLTRKGDAQQRRTWKNHFNIIPYSRVVRGTANSLYIGGTMAAERVKTVEDRKVGSVSFEYFNLICIFCANLHISRIAT
jgi:hypothetical protein